MKKIILILLLFVVYGCNKKYCDFVDSNEETLNELMKLVQENPNEFFNNQSEPRVYYTYNYQKSPNEFEKTTVSKNILLKDYKSFKRIFNELSIEEFLIYDNQNILFKVNDADFFVTNFGFYVGYLKHKSLNEIKKDLDIIEFDKCGNDWYYILERSSIAN